MRKVGFLKCEVCTKITQIKIQVAYLDYFPVHICCGNCGTIFSGKYFKDDEMLITHAEFKNATEISDLNGAKIDFYCDVSGELLMRKVTAVQSKYDLFDMPMWMKFKNRLGTETLKKLFGSIREFHVLSSDKAKYEWSRILDLWFSNKHYYLKSELVKVFGDSPNSIPLHNKKDYLSAMRRITTTFFSPIYSKTDYEDSLNNLRKNLKTLIDTKENDYKNYLKCLNDLGIFMSCEKMIYEQLKNFIKYFENLIPSYSLSFLTEQERQGIFEPSFEYGVTTIPFEEVKFLYMDLFESVVKCLVIPVGLNNLYHRGDFNIFLNNGVVNRNENINDINGFCSIFTAANKIKFLDNSETFSCLIHTELNNKLRNSIGHYDYRYDDLEQTIFYDKERKKISLINFGYNCYELCLSLLDLFMLTTFLHETYFYYWGEN